MSNQIKVIDFKELQGSVKGEGLEQLMYLLAERLKLVPVWTGRGPDSGKDLTFTEIPNGPLSTKPIKWVVSCKDKAVSGDTVSEKDLPSITDKIKQHKAHGFLLVTTTAPGVAAKALIDGQDVSEGGQIHTQVWDDAYLTMMLLKAENHDLVKQFLPKSYQRIKQLGALEEMIQGYRQDFPAPVFHQIIELIRPYSGKTLSGQQIWPYDADSSQAIDQIIACLLTEDDPDKAVLETENIEYDAFVAFVNKLDQDYPEEAHKYLTSLIHHHEEADLVFNAYQLLISKQEITPTENIDLATYLDKDSLSLLFGGDVRWVVEEDVRLDPGEYGIDSPFNSLPGLNALEQVDNVEMTSLIFDPDPGVSLQFSGTLDMDVILSHDPEDPSSDLSVTGTFTGYIDESGTHLESVGIDASSLDLEDAEYPEDAE